MSVKLQTCPHCRTAVAPTADDNCPSCRRSLSGSTTRPVHGTVTIKLPLLPSGNPLPLDYRWIRAHGLHSLAPWHFDFDDEASVRQWRELHREDIRNDAWPFASRQDRMEVAAFPLRHGKSNGKVIVLDTDPSDNRGIKPGGPIETHRSFLAWFSTVMIETQEWMNEEELADILDD